MNPAVLVSEPEKIVCVLFVMILEDPPPRSMLPAKINMLETGEGRVSAGPEFKGGPKEFVSKVIITVWTRGIMKPPESLTALYTVRLPLGTKFPEKIFRRP